MSLIGDLLLLIFIAIYTPLVAMVILHFAGVSIEINAHWPADSAIIALLAIVGILFIIRRF